MPIQQQKEKPIFLAIVSALGCGLMGGLLFAFSNFVMRALSNQPPASGIRTMQAINVSILNPLFFLVFFGTAAASISLVVSTILRRPHACASLLVTAAALYLIGTVGVTLVFNVPLNDKLAMLNPDTAEAANYWLKTYLSEWVKWNHIRTIASIMATALLLWAIRRLAAE